MGKISKIICKFLNHDWVYYSNTRRTKIILTLRRDSNFEDGDSRVCRTCLQIEEYIDGKWNQVSGP